MPLATMAVTDGGGQAVAQTLVQTAGSRTFFLRDGVWVDSAYDTATEPRLIPFASDAYFELLTARPELGEALALGEEMLLVVEGEALRISSGGGEAQTTDTPTASDAVAQTGTDTPPATDEQPAGMTSVGLQGCASALILPLLVMAGWGVSRRRGRATN